MQYLQQHYIEILGAILSLIYLYLSIKQKVSLWVFGFLSALLYIFVFYRSQLYAIMTLQFYYVAVSIYGWVSWRVGKQATGEELPARRSSFKNIIFLLGFGFLIFLAYYFFLLKYTDAFFPLIDSFTTAFSIIATWMLARKLIEHWLFWIVIDSISAGLYFYRGLYPTAILFIVYAIMAIVGWIEWKKSMNKEIK